MPNGKDTASLQEVIAPQEVISCFEEIQIQEISKVVPDFNRADTMKITEDGTIAVLLGIEIYVEEVGSGGGPQGDETRISRPFFLENMYPNPARGIINIRFNSPDERKVTVKLYDVAGRLAEKIFDGKAMIGMNRIPLVVNTLATGVYFIQIDAGNYNKVEKLILLR